MVSELDLRAGPAAADFPSNLALLLRQCVAVLLELVVKDWAPHLRDKRSNLVPTLRPWSGGVENKWWDKAYLVAVEDPCDPDSNVGESCRL